MTRLLRAAPVTVRAAAKINLHLGVGAPRGDGFHPLTTVYQAVGLCDDVTAADPDSDEWELEVTARDWVDVADIPVDGTNIVDRAATLLAEHHGVRRRGRVAVDKSIPVAGGLAGGSADAAAALVALDRLWGLGTSDQGLLQIAAALGSDVPFALLGGTAVGTGRGEIVTRVRDPGSWWWVIVPDREGMSTPAVYRHFDKLFPDAAPAPPGADELLAAIDSGEAQRLADALHNDLQDPAIDLRPHLGQVIATGESEGALRGLVSGSGPTCVFLCESADHARELAGTMGRLDHRVVLVANGAVAGAHLVAHG